MHVANIVTALVAAVAGLFAGTYATTLMTRARDDASPLPVGLCPECGHRLSWGEMTPVVSYVTRHGLCAHCEKPYGARYLVTELVTAVLFGLIGLKFGPSPVLAAYLYLTFACVVLSAIDIDCKRLPDVLTKPSLLATGGLLAIAVPHMPFGVPHFVYAVIGMLALWGIYFLLWLINPRGMAWGDVKLAPSLGLALGWLGMNAFIIGTFAGFLFGAVSGLSMVVLGRLKLKSAIPFGPYMCAGALAGILLSDVISLPV